MTKSSIVAEELLNLLIESMSDKNKQQTINYLKAFNTGNRVPISDNEYPTINTVNQFFSAIYLLKRNEGVTYNKSGKLVVHLPSAIKSLHKLGISISNERKLHYDLHIHKRFLTEKSTRALGKKVTRACHFAPF